MKDVAHRLNANKSIQQICLCSQQKRNHRCTSLFLALKMATKPNYKFRPLYVVE